VTAWNLRLDRLELAADIVGRVGLRVPDIDMARPALEEDQDDLFGAAEARRALVLLGRLLHFGARFELQERRQAETEQPRAPDAHKLPAGNAVTIDYMIARYG
jgi:hypothetical protein